MRLFVQAFYFIWLGNAYLDWQVVKVTGQLHKFERSVS